VCSSDLGIKIYTVGAGASGIVAMPVQDPFGGTQYARVRSDIDEATLTRIAETTGARYFRAADLETLTKVYDEIDRMEKTETEVEHFTRFDERFAPFLLAGMLCLCAERFLSLSRWGRLP
jgi:Ca-activated chloride channel family protein